MKTARLFPAWLAYLVLIMMGLFLVVILGAVLFNVPINFALEPMIGRLSVFDWAIIAYAIWAAAVNTRKQDPTGIWLNFALALGWMAAELALSGWLWIMFGYMAIVVMANTIMMIHRLKELRNSN